MIEFALVLVVEKVSELANRGLNLKQIAPENEDIHDIQNPEFDFGKANIAALKAGDSRNDTKVGGTEISNKKKHVSSINLKLTEKIDCAAFMLFNTAYVVFNFFYFLRYD